jgi:CheY-like chemotaxis protein
MAPRARARDERNGDEPGGFERVSGVLLLVLRRFMQQLNTPLDVATANLDFALAHLETADADELRGALQEARVAIELARALTVERAASTPEPASSSAPTRRDMTQISGPQSRVVRVLVVNDDAELGKAIARSLRDYDVLRLDSTSEAWGRIAAGDRFDFIVCDLLMPGMDGLDLYTAIERVAPEQADGMIFMSGGPTRGKTRELVASVPNVVLQKPFDMDKLLDFIRTRLAAREV